jgi:hypothetical protein
MILPLGVSPFTRGNHTYRIDETAAELIRIYEALRNFPRLGLIVYADAFVLGQVDKDDFSISTDNRLTAAYRKAVSCEVFLSTVERNSDATERWQRASTHGIFHEGRIYLSTHTIQSELQLPMPSQTQRFGENYFASAHEIHGKLITTCENRRVIFVENLP